MSAPIDKTEFKAYFVREFNYGAKKDTVMDSDIDRAIAEGSLEFNGANLGSVADQKTAYLYLTAHLLALNIQAAGGLGAVNLGAGVYSTGDGPIQSASVGSVSTNYALPDHITQNIAYAGFMKTTFGQRYLSMISSALVAPIFVVGGPTIADGQ